MERWLLRWKIGLFTVRRDVPGIPAKGDILDLLGNQVKSVPHCWERVVLAQRRPSPVRFLCMVDTVAKNSN